MTFQRPTPEQTLAGLRSIKTVLSAAGPVDETRRAVLSAAQTHVLHTNHDFDALERISPTALAAAIPEPQLRDQISRALCLYVMFPDAPAQAEVLAAEAFVAALGGPKDAIEVMRATFEQRMLTLRFDAMRRSFMGDSSRRLLRDQGPLAVLANVGEILGIHSNDEVAARYRALGDLNENTLGHALHSFYTTRGFRFPGEHGGAPESIVAHDLTHVLTGHDTTLPDEACVTAFQAGYRREDPFTGLLFVILNMQKGLQMTRLAPGKEHMFAEPGMAERIVASWAAGTQATLDLVKDWNCWDDMARPIADVRARLNILPTHLPA